MAVVLSQENVRRKTLQKIMRYIIMSKTRIFQDYEGDIKEVVGLQISGLKAIVDQVDYHVILIWIGVNNNSSWYRIFIDGYYCGIDIYESDLSNEDLDDDILIVDYTCINGETIENTSVEAGNEIYGESSIVLTIEFLSGKKLLLFCYDSDGECKLTFLPS